MATSKVTAEAALAPGGASDTRGGAPKDVIRRAVLERLTYDVHVAPERAAPHDWLVALTLAVRDRVVDAWSETERADAAIGRKRVYYLSLEFLIGRLLNDAMVNLGMRDACSQAMAELGVDLDELVEVEPDAALGNGGLGRLAACFMESMASVGVSGFGYGIRYQHGLFRQGLDDGWQIERPEDWLAYGNPWGFERPPAVYEIGFGGRAERLEKGGPIHWTPAEIVLAEAYDTPVVGWMGERVNTLRLWSARSPHLLHLEKFEHGDYAGAHEHQLRAESISKMLYPNDSTPAGQELRLRQEYFFSAASLQDLLARHLRAGHGVETLPDHVAIQLNDTHPAIAVVELLRLLIDRHGMSLAPAFALARRCFGYTNHTLLPEALESWPTGLMERLLPRHMQLIYELNALILQGLRARPDNTDPFLSSVSLIDESHGRRVRMGNLAFIGSHKTNGVSALHTDLLQKTLFADLERHFPGRITGVTNGVTPRRWLVQCNPPLATLFTETIGDGWIRDLSQLERLRDHAKDPAFRARFRAAKQIAQERLLGVVTDHIGHAPPADALYDVHIKRIHEYKRQLLNILEAIALYNEIRCHPEADWAPRVKIFAGKAAASYTRAKLIIKLINDVAQFINKDGAADGRLEIVFLKNYNVSLAEKLIPAANLSEQISTAGMEASGTGNMKFALNGAITIGTLDGANVEMREQMGDANMVVFGLEADEVAARRAEGWDKEAVVARSPKLQTALDMLENGVFSPDDPHRYRPIVEDLRHHDWFMVAADFDAYYAAQRQVDALWRDQERWTDMAIANAASMGYFSSDRSIEEYARKIWRI